VSKALRFRFWFEMGMAALTSFLFVVTLIWRNWIEIVFNVEPDNGYGSFEWFIVGVLFVLTGTLFMLARNEWRRSHAVP
jgi:hypothetical protein